MSRKPRTMQIPIYNPQTEQLLKDFTTQLAPQLENNNLDFEPIRENALAEYERMTAPTISQRMQGMMGNSSQRSSSQWEAQDAGKRNMLQNLAAQEQNFNLSRQGLLNQMMQLSLTPTHDTIMMPRRPSAWDRFVGKAPQVIGSAAMGALSGAAGGPAGMAAGAFAGGLMGLGAGSSGEGYETIYSALKNYGDYRATRNQPTKTLGAPGGN